MQLWNEIYFKDDVLKGVKELEGEEPRVYSGDKLLLAQPASFFLSLILQLPVKEKKHPLP